MGKKHYVAHHNKSHTRFIIQEFGSSDVKLFADNKYFPPSGSYSGHSISINDTDEIIREADASISSLIDYIAKAQAVALLTKLTISGNGDLPMEIAQKVILSLIPFYDCVNDIRAGNNWSAGIGCTLDILSIITIPLGIGSGLAKAAKATSVAAKSALVNHGLRRALIAASNTMGKQIFNKSAGKWLLRESIDLVDPGVNLVFCVGKFILKKTWKLLRLTMDVKSLHRLGDLKIIKPFDTVKLTNGKNINLLKSDREYRSLPVYFQTDDYGNVLMGQRGLIAKKMNSGVEVIPVDDSPLISTGLKSQLSAVPGTPEIKSELLSKYNDKGLRMDSKGNEYLEVDDKFIMVKETQNQPEKNINYVINNGDEAEIVVCYDHGTFHLEGTSEKLEHVTLLGNNPLDIAKAEKRTLDPSVADVVLPEKRRKLNNYEFSGHLDDVVFPEYGANLSKQEYDLDSYQKFFEGLSKEEKSAIAEWVAIPADQNIPKSYELNERLRNEIPLTPELSQINKNLASAIHNLRLPKRKGDYLRFEQYFADDINPWLNGDIVKGDILDTGYAFTSFSGKDLLAKNVVQKGIKVKDADVECMVFYKVVDAEGGLPLPEGIATQGRGIYEQLYAPGTRFKVVDYSVAKSTNTDLPTRVGVVLQEVDPASIDEYVPLKKWFSGEELRAAQRKTVSLSDLIHGQDISKNIIPASVISVKKNAEEMMDSFSDFRAGLDDGALDSSIILPD